MQEYLRCKTLRLCPIILFFFLMKASLCAYKRNILLNSTRQHNHFITQGNYKATCFDYRLVILRPEDD